MTLLSRVAEQLYWAARYMERAEGTARVVREHTNLLVDMPVSVPLGWDPILDMTGEREAYAERHARPEEGAIIRFLVSDPESAGSIRSSVERARENLRSCREIVPAEAWLVVNDLHMYLTAHEGRVDRRRRGRVLGRVIDDHQRLLGILYGGMSRDLAFTMMRLGRHVERAALTARVLDVRAATLLDAHDDVFDDVQWIGVLRSLSALQAYHRAVAEPVSGASATRFLLFETAFPRSVAHCLTMILQTAGQLPPDDGVMQATMDALAALTDLDPDSEEGVGLREGARQLGTMVGDLHERLAEAYFPPVGGALALSGPD